jgi:hypothetical protein
VPAALTELFRRHGLPRRMPMDNGAPWGDDGGHPGTPPTVWLLRSGVAVRHGRPCHPQTQGKGERFHRTPHAERLSRPPFANLADCRGRFTPWRHVYRHERPHEALGLAVPAGRYRVSPRAFPAPLPPIAYEATDTARPVRDKGRFRFRGQAYRVAKAFRGCPIALRAAGQEGVRGGWFCTHRRG